MEAQQQAQARAKRDKDRAARDAAGALGSRSPAQDFGFCLTGRRILP